MNKTAAEKQEILKRGVASDFWEIVCEGIDKEVERLEVDQRDEKMFKLTAEQYKFEHQILMAKIKYLKKLQEIPEEVIVSLNDFKSEEKEEDPYYSSEDFKK